MSQLTSPRKHPLMKDVARSLHPGTKCTPDFIDDYCKLAKKGYTKNMISKTLNVKIDTIMKWELWGAEPGAPEDSVYVQFLARSKKAHRYVTDHALDTITSDIEAGEESKTSVKTAMWWMERMEGDSFGPPTQRHEGTIKHEHTHVHQLSTEELYDIVLGRAQDARPLNRGDRALQSGPEEHEDEWQGDYVDVDPGDEEDDLE